MIILMGKFYRTRTNAILQVVDMRNFQDSFYADFCFLTDLGSTPYRADGRVFRDRLDPMDLVEEVDEGVSDAEFLRQQMCPGVFVKWQGEFFDTRDKENCIPDINWYDIETALLTHGEKSSGGELDVKILRLLAKPSAEMISNITNCISATNAEINEAIRTVLDSDEFDSLHEALCARRRALRDKRNEIQYIHAYP